MKYFILSLTLIVVMLFMKTLNACEFREENFESKAISQKEYYTVLLPKNHDPSLSYSAVYFLHGRGGDRHNIQSLEFCKQLDAWIDKGGTPFIMIAPDGKNSYWMNGALTHQNWGDMVASELIADVESKFPLISSPKGRMIAGISMGGHGAIQISLNYPNVFGAIAAHSPVFRTQEEASRDFYYEFGTGVDYQKRDPFSLMMIFKKSLNVPIFIDMGGSDPWITNTRNFAHYLTKIGYEGEEHVGEDLIGGHSGEYWNHHMVSYMAWYGKNLLPPRQL